MDGNPDDNFSLSSIFSQSYFVIPNYQRDYAWDESNVNDLLEDIDFVYEQNKSTHKSEKLDHYFGTIVFEERGSVEPTDFEDYDVFGIVDGQQRLATVSIVISAIVDEMEAIASKDDIGDEIEEKIRQRSNDIEEKYIEYKGIERISLGGLAKEAYDDVILGSCQAQSYLESSELVEAERKVLQAKEVASSKLQEWKNEKFNQNNSGYSSYYKFLNNVVKILTQRFEVNVKIVEDVDEAARMFKVINNRGRGLSLHDKVRSHLVYCASQSPRMDSENIYNKFNNIIENITIHDGFSDAEVDDLIRIHWAVFTSERSDSRAKRAGPSEIHRRLSDLDDYASVQREDYELFITPYINSLERFSERYPYLTDRKKFASEYSNMIGESEDILMEDTIQKIQLIYMHPAVQSATAPLLISVAEKFDVVSEEFADVVSELEKLVFRFSLVMTHGAQGYKSALSSIANDIYWSDIEPSKVEEIFNSESNRYIGHKSKELGIKKCIKRLEEKRERIAPMEDVISGYLRERDILNGHYTSGWGGVRNNEVVKYIMYEYERSLRGQSGLLSLSPYHEFRENFQVEHLVPRNAEAGNKLSNHDRNKDRLGNLAVLSAQENGSKGNSSFEHKYEDIYKESSLKILRDLSGPDFSVDDINDREEAELLPFIEQRW
ncbi:DUF262 domain-containing protein [Halosimplex sp. TS25]|uniref:DUF262 domain-containing protein n=1 Tax=Halosimplex rarum TaxID=3396619 RepID=UPI0039E9FAE0